VNHIPNFLNFMWSRDFSLSCDHEILTCFFPCPFNSLTKKKSFKMSIFLVNHAKRTEHCIFDYLFVIVRINIKIPMQIT